MSQTKIDKENLENGKEKINGTKSAVDVDDIIGELICKSQKAKEFAYCPYSKFRVGAAVLAPNGKIFTGKIMNSFNVIWFQDLLKSVLEILEYLVILAVILLH